MGDNCLKCEYCKFGHGNPKLSPTGHYGVCVFLENHRVLPEMDLFLLAHVENHKYTPPDWCPLNKDYANKEEKLTMNKKSDEPKKDKYADTRCFGCKRLFVCFDRFRCNGRLFLDTMEGPSGFLEVDNVLKAVPDWCPGREESVDGSDKEERTCPYCHGIGRCISVLYAPTLTRLSLEEFMNHTVVCSNCSGTGKVSVRKEPIEDKSPHWVGSVSGKTEMGIDPGHDWLKSIKVKITDRAALESIDPINVASWLEKHGWEAEPGGLGKINKILKFSRVISGETHIIELPIFSELRDYALRIAEVLDVLADVEKRSQLEIFDEIKNIQ